MDWLKALATLAAAALAFIPSRAQKYRKDAVENISDAEKRQLQREGREKEREKDVP